MSLGELTEEQVTRAMLEICEPTLSGGTVQAGAILHTFSFGMNPKEYAIQAKASWKSEPNKQGVRPPQFQGGSPASLKLEAFLDWGIENGSITDQVDWLLATVQPTGQSRGSNPFPPVLRFIWGESSTFIGVASSVDAKFTYFAGDGTPLRAVCTISLQVFDGNWPRQNPTSGTLRIDRAHQVRLGDSLASIAHREYGDPTMWRAIALANRIVDPHELRIGEHLLVPPATEAARLLERRS